MDPALQRAQELFKKRSLAVPAVENRQKKEKQSKDSPPPAKKRVKKDWQEGPSPSIRDPLFARTLTSAAASSKFNILKKIVLKLKSSYLDGCTDSIEFEVLLDETNQLDISQKHKHWLVTEALPNNPRIRITTDNLGVTRYAYKPPFPTVKDRNSLKKLLNNYDMRGKGGVDMDEVIDSLPNAEKIVKMLVERNDIVMIARPDKKRILFAKDNGMEFKVDEEFQKHWRSIAVEGIDEQKIEEYLNKQGIQSMHGSTKAMPVQKRKQTTKVRKNRNFKKHNEHMKDILDDYSDKV